MQTFSFIIPVKPGGILESLDALYQLDSRNFQYEILIAEGKQPSRQRNLAAHEASGTLLYFLDDDSLITPDCLNHCVSVMEDVSVAVAGGPSLTPYTDTWLQQLFGHALSSPFGAGATRNRYRATGSPRETTEKELILCNMAIRRNVFLDTGGFDERLYPNEENELLDRISRSGLKLMHIPAMAVHRSQRVSFQAFVRQMFSYGRGRAQQTLLAGPPYSLSSFIPLAFLLYVILFPLFPSTLLWKLPLLLYLALDILVTGVIMYRQRKMFLLLLLTIFPVMHLSNGWGLLCGFLGGRPKTISSGNVVIRKIKEFGHSD